MRRGYWYLKACEITALVALFSAIRPYDWLAWALCLVGAFTLNICGYIEGTNRPWTEGHK